MNSTVFVAMLVIAAIILVVSVLVLVTRRQTRQRIEALRAGYQSLLSQHGLTATTEQEFGHRILGLDGVQKVLVMFQPAAESGHLVLPLADVRDCSIRKEGVSLRHGKGATEEHVNSISLSLRLHNGTAVDVPIWSEVLDGIEEKIPMHKSAVTWQGRIKAALSAPALAA